MYSIIILHTYWSEICMTMHCALDMENLEANSYILVFNTVIYHDLTIIVTVFAFIIKQTHVNDGIILQNDALTAILKQQKLFVSKVCGS